MFHSGNGPIAVFEDAAWVDRSHVGKLRVSGADRLDLLHRLSTNDLLSLKPFSSRGTVFTTDKGRIVDYVRVLVYPDSLLLVTSSNRVDRLRAWIEKYTIMEDIQLEDVTSFYSMSLLLGSKVFESITSSLGKSPHADTIYAGDFQGFDLTVDYQKEFGIQWANVLTPTRKGENPHEPFEHLSEHAVPFIDEPMFQYFRIANGIPGEGEMRETFNPYDVNLRHAISYTKGCYIGQEVIARLDTYQKATRGLALLSFEHEIRLLEELGLPVLMNGESIGTLTSSSAVAFEGKHLGLGVLKKSEATVGSRVVINERTKGFDAIIERVFDQTGR